MKQGPEQNQKTLTEELIKEAEVFYDSKIKPKEEKGEIDSEMALSILDNLARARNLPNNDPEKLNIVESEMNRMKRIAEREKNTEENLKYQSKEKFTLAELSENAFEFSQAVSLVLQGLYGEKLAYENIIDNLIKERDERAGTGKKPVSLLNKARLKKTYKEATEAINGYETLKKAILRKISFYENLRILMNTDAIKDAIEKEIYIDKSEKKALQNLLDWREKSDLQKEEPLQVKEEEKEDVGSLEEGRAVPYTFPELKYRLKYKQMESGEYREDLFIFRSDISEAVEDLYGEKQVLDEKINEFYEKFDEVFGNSFFDIADNLVNLQKEREALQEKISFYQKLQISNDPESEINGAFLKNTIDESEKEAILQLLRPEKEELKEELREDKKEETREKEEEKKEEKSLFDRMYKVVSLISERKVEENHEERSRLLIDLTLFVDIDLIKRLDEAYFLKLLINKDEYHILRPLVLEFVEEQERELKRQKEEEAYYQKEYKEQTEEEEVRTLLRKRDKSEIGYAPQKIAKRKKFLKKGGKRDGDDEEKKKEEIEKQEQEKREKKIIEELKDHPIVGRVYADMESSYKCGFIPERYFLDIEAELRDILISDEPREIAKELFGRQFLTSGEYMWLLGYFERQKIYEKIDNLAESALLAKKEAYNLFNALKEKEDFSDNCAEVIYGILDELSRTKYCLHKIKEMEESVSFEGKKQDSSEVKEIIPALISKEEREVFRTRIFADTGFKIRYYFKLNLKKLFSKWSNDYFAKKMERQEFKEKEAFAKNLTEKIGENGGFKKIPNIISNAFEQGVINEEEKKILSSIYS